MKYVIIIVLISSSTLNANIHANYFDVRADLDSFSIKLIEFVNIYNVFWTHLYKHSVPNEFPAELNQFYSNDGIDQIWYYLNIDCKNSGFLRYQHFINGSLAGSLVRSKELELLAKNRKQKKLMKLVKCIVNDKFFETIGSLSEVRNRIGRDKLILAYILSFPSKIHNDAIIKLNKICEILDVTVYNKEENGLKEYISLINRGGNRGGNRGIYEKCTYWITTEEMTIINKNKN